MGIAELVLITEIKTVIEVVAYHQDSYVMLMLMAHVTTHTRVRAVNDQII